MGKLMPAYGTSGGSSDSGVDIPDSHIFADTDARDSYFSSNPNELTDGVFSSSGAVLQKYVDGSWVDVTQLLKGDKGDAGTSGSSAHPQYSSDNISFHDELDPDNDIYIRFVTTDSDGNTSVSAGKMFSASSMSGSLLTPEQEAKIDSIEEPFTADEKLDLSNAVSRSHNHDNKSILDNTTASFTTAFETKLSNLTDHFKGVFANATARDLAILSPLSGDYCKQTDTGSFWFYGGAVWVDSGSSSTGDMMSAIYDPQNIGDDAFDRANHTGSQDQSTISGLTEALDEKQDTNAALAGTTASFTAELKDQIEALISTGSATGKSAIAYYSSSTRRNNGANFTADSVSPYNTMTVNSDGTIVAPYDGLYRIDVYAQGNNNNSTVVLSAGYYFLYSVNGGSKQQLGNTQIQFERLNWTNGYLSSDTMGLVQLSAGDEVIISTTSLTQTSYIQRFQVIVEYKG